MSVGATVIELHVFKKKKKTKKKEKRKMGFWYNIHIWCFFAEIFGILFCFHIFSAVKIVKVKKALKLNVKTEFPNVR